MMTIYTGQLGWHLMALMTFAWLDARSDRWGRAGVWYGLALSIKPFLLILVPLLVLQRRWKALSVTTATTAAAYAVGLLVFGVANHRSWLDCLARTDNWAWLEINASLWGLFSRTFVSNLIFEPAAELPLRLLKLTWLICCGAMGLLTLFIAWRDRSEQRLDRAFALLLVGSVLFCPLGWVYYWWLPAGPLVVLAVRWVRRSDEGSPWRVRLLWLALPGFLCPVPWLHWLQPNALATILLGNIYVWTTLCVWLALVVDGLPHVRWSLRVS
jgi:hypothetical protein